MSFSDYQTSFELNPIILVGGVSQLGPVPLGFFTSNSGLATDFGNFRILSGGTLMDNQVATYPFANQTTAANAIITQPLKISLEMVFPADSVKTLSIKMALFSSLKKTLDQHTALGGWYNVATPNYVYQGCLLTSLVDATEELDGTQPQVRWVWNFMQPLLTADAAQARQNPTMSAISGQTTNTQKPGATSSPSTISNPSSNTAQNVVKKAKQPLGSNIAYPGIFKTDAVSQESAQNLNSFRF